MALKIYVVVLNWNGWRDTAECVESVLPALVPGSGVLIVDNGSTGDDVERLTGRFADRAEFLETGENLGFAGGSNAGINHALGRGADYVVLLNNDTVVDPAFLSELLAAARANPRAGMLCSKVYFHDRPDTLWYAGASFFTALGWGRMRGYNEVDRGRYDAVEETERPTGCSLMVTRELCERVGLLDEEYFCYVEDTDWGMRARKAGIRILYVPGSRVWHKVSSSTGGHATAVSLYYNMRNTLLCLRKNSPLPFPLGSLRLLVVASAGFLSLFTMKIPKVTGARRILRGVADHLRGRYGKLG